jgi:hypothetical protein
VYSSCIIRISIWIIFSSLKPSLCISRSTLSAHLRLAFQRIWTSNVGGYEDFYRPGFNGIWSYKPVIRRNISPTSSGSKWKSSKKPAWSTFNSLLLALFDPEDGGDMFLRLTSWFVLRYISLYPRGGKSLWANTIFNELRNSKFFWDFRTSMCINCLRLNLEIYI